MKKLLFIICSMLGLCAHAQQINYAEYFFDTDPGQGAGIQISFTAADSVNITTGLVINSLTPGFHILYFRTRNTAGTWSMYQGRKFYIGTTPPVVQDKITHAEFFFDADNGFDQGTTINMTAADSVNVTTSISTAGLAPGFHRLYARVRDSSGRWSLYRGNQFFIDGTPQLLPAKVVSAEYFYDYDPGAGNGLPINTGAPADSVQIGTGLSIASLSPGYHNVYIRAKDSNGMWSNYQSGYLFKEANEPATSSRIVEAEYFINTDPGMGNATPVPSFATADSIDINCIVATTGLAIGDDTLYVRVKDSTGIWSFPRMYKFTIQSQGGNGIDDIHFNGDFDAHIVPNPVIDVANLYIKSNKQGAATVTVLSYTGVKLWQNQFELHGEKELRIDVGHLPAGMYLVEVQSGDNKLTRRLVKR